MMRKLLLLLVFVLYGSNISAQDSRSQSSGVPELKTFIASLKANEQTSRQSAAAYSPAQSVEDLVYKVQPAQYLSSGIVKTYGEKPKHLFIDVQSMNGLNNAALLKNNIDIVTIRINSANDLNATIDLSLFSSFTSLKYVHVVSAVNASPASIASMVRNPEERLTVFYSIEVGE